MSQPHLPDQAVFRSVLPEEIDWQPFAAFPPSARLAVVVGDPSRSGPYVVEAGSAGGQRGRRGSAGAFSVTAMRPVLAAARFRTRDDTVGLDVSVRSDLCTRQTVSTMTRRVVPESS